MATLPKQTLIVHIIRFQIFLEPTYVDNLWNGNSAKFGAFFALFGPFRAIFGVVVRFKTCLGPTYVDNFTIKAK